MEAEAQWRCCPVRRSGMKKEENSREVEHQHVAPGDPTYKIGYSGVFCGGSKTLMPGIRGLA